jgi:hypothetical protein
MRAQPYPKETLLAQKRFQNFLRRANAKGRVTLAETPFVAVRAYQLDANHRRPNGQVNEIVLVNHSVEKSIISSARQIAA